MIKVFNKIIINVFALITIFIPKEKKQDCLEEQEPIEQVVEDTIKIPQDSVLVYAMIQVESGGKEDMVGDKNLRVPSIGVLQIRPIMVREVNRVLKKQKIKKKYNLKDRFSRKKSIEMFYIWKDYHHECDTDEVIARCWNGGPRGWKKEATEWYWTKVKREIKKLKNDKIT